MEGLAEIASSGSPGIVTALGMGTVFVCLVALYVTTRIIGDSLPWMMRSASRKEPIEAKSSTAGNDSVATESDSGASAGEGQSGETGIIAAMTLALARHRSARMRPAVSESTGADPWKMAGRIQTLRNS